MDNSVGALPCGCPSISDVINQDFVLEGFLGGDSPYVGYRVNTSRVDRS